MSLYENASIDEEVSTGGDIDQGGRNPYEKPLPDPPSNESLDKTEGIYFVPDAIYARPHQSGNGCHICQTVTEKREDNFIKTIWRRKTNIIMITLTVLVILALAIAISSLAMYTQNTVVAESRETDSNNKTTLEMLTNLEKRMKIIESERENQFRKTLEMYNWYKAENGYWYKVFQNKVEYTNARKNCEVLGSRLASVGIRSQKIKRDLTQNLLDSTSQQTWIGLDNIQQNGSWTWSDQVLSTLNNTQWRSGYPDNENKNRKCGYLFYGRNWSITGRDCGRLFYYLCETLQPL
uniref:hepatic lectin-like n=1 Tax=Styela clava TaxID=7725 RepID=UPI00193AD61D|nr:hepatic lectin-like [Styela clava]